MSHRIRWSPHVCAPVFLALLTAAASDCARRGPGRSIELRRASVAPHRSLPRRPRLRGGRRPVGLQHLLLRNTWRRRLEEHERRADVGADLRPDRDGLHWRARHRAVEPADHLRRHRRRDTRRRRLQVDRRREVVDQRRPARHALHRIDRHQRDQPGRSGRGRDRRPHTEPGSRCLPHHRRREDMDEGALCRRHGWLPIRRRRARRTARAVRHAVSGRRPQRRVARAADHAGRASSGARRTAVQARAGASSNPPTAAPRGRSSPRRDSPRRPSAARRSVSWRRAAAASCSRACTTGSIDLKTAARPGRARTTTRASRRSASSPTRATRIWSTSRRPPSIAPPTAAARSKPSPARPAATISSWSGSTLTTPTVSSPASTRAPSSASTRAHRGAAGTTSRRVSSTTWSPTTDFPTTCTPRSRTADPWPCPTAATSARSAIATGTRLAASSSAISPPTRSIRTSSLPAAGIAPWCGSIAAPGRSCTSSCRERNTDR